MAESLVITLREGIEAALVVGIILAYLRKTGRSALSRQVYAGLGLALLASAGVAWAFGQVGFDPENEYLEGAMLGLGGIFVASMVVWMWRTARGLKRELEERLASITQRPAIAAGDGVGWGLLLFTFFMVLREGVETVIFLSAAALGEAADPLSFLGGAIGLGLATLFALLFVRGSLQINLSRFFNVTGAVLLALAVKLLAGSLHEFGEVKLIPMSKEAMYFLGYFVRDDSSAVILMVLVTVPIFLLLWESLRRPVSSDAGEGVSAADRRKRRAQARLERTWQVGLAGAAGLVVLSLASTVFARGMVDPTPEPITASGAAVHVPLSRLAEGQLHKFAYAAADGTQVRFLLARMPDGTLASGLDACEICGALGYGQEGGVAICKNCNAPIPFDTFAFGGGCNPLRLSVAVAGDEAAVAVADLDAAVKVFR